MSFSVSGLSSGLDTSSLIDALMYAERATIRRLESSKAKQDAALKAWSDIETRLGELRSSSEAIRTGGALSATLAESSDESVLRASASAGALPGSYTMRVDKLAAAHQVASSGLGSGADLTGAGVATVAGGFASMGTEVVSHTLNEGTYALTVVSIDEGANEATVVFDGVEQTVSIGPGPRFTVRASDGGQLRLAAPPQGRLQTGSASITVVETDSTTTVNGLAAKLNSPGGAVRAQVIDTGDGTTTSYRLVLTSTRTGEAHAADIDFSGLSGFSDGLTTLRDASDASISIGGLTITRPTNTIGNLFDGLSIDLVGVSQGQDVEIVVSADHDSSVESVRSVVDALNGVLSSLAGYTGYNVDGGSGGPLVGSFSARSVSRELTNAAGTVVTASSFALLAQIGVSFQSDGTYTLDEAKLRAALTSDPVGVARVLQGDVAVPDDGVLDVLDATIGRLVQEAGRIPTAKTAAEDTIEQLDRSIEAQEVRLANVEDRYKRQFAALEALLGQLQSQSSYLTSLIGQQQKQGSQG